MGVLVYVLGRSGTGKSFSMRNFDPEDLEIINVQGKILPFRGSGKYHIVNTDNSADIVTEIKSAAKQYKSIVVDDFQYVMANEFMRRSTEKGYDKFTEIGRHAWDITDCVRSLPGDVIVYVMCHTDTDPDGFEKLKTIGKLLDEKIVLEGMSTIVLKTAVSDGQYTFLTQNNGHDTVKSPAGMFPSFAIDNDLKYVDDKIRNYYEIGDFKSDEEMAKADDEAKTDVDPTVKKRRGRRGEEKKEEPIEAPVEEEEEKPKRRSRKSSDEVKQVEEENEEAIAEAGLSDDGEEQDFDDVEMPEIKEPPRRKRRNVSEETETTEEPKETTPTDEAPRRRRRRG